MAITPAAARARLERMVAASAVPELGAAEVDDLLVLAERGDSAGLLSGEVGWVATYDLNAAAAEGWRWKAARVAGEYTVGQDGSTLNRSDMHKHCMLMAAHFAAREGALVGDITTTSRAKSATLQLTPVGAGVGYGPAVAREDGRVTDYGPPTLVLGEE